MTDTEEATHSDAAALSVLESINHTTEVPGGLERRYTVQEVAIISHYKDVGVIYRAIDKEELKYERPGGHGRYLIKESDLLAWLKGKP